MSSSTKNGWSPRNKIRENSNSAELTAAFPVNTQPSLLHGSISNHSYASIFIPLYCIRVMNALEFHSCLWAKSSSCYNIRWTLLSPIIMPASQIALSCNYQGAIFILTSCKEWIFITMSTAASQEWLVSQLSNLSTSFECTIQWHISKWRASWASYIHWKEWRVIQSSQPKWTLPFMLFLNRYCIWILPGIM